MFKRLIRGLGLPVMDWREVRSARWARDPAGVLAELEAFAVGRRRRAPDGQARAARQLRRHDAGARRPESGRAALETAFRFDDLALVERYLAGARDLEVAVIGNEPDALEQYGPGEILSGHEFYDYAAKYTPGLSETTTGAEVDRDRAGGHAQARPRRLPGRSAARASRGVDFLLAGEQLFVSRDQHDPGLHADQPLPDAAAAGGYDFAAVCRRVVDLALERAAGRVRHAVTADDLPR